MTIDDFILPFEGKLNPENRWVKLSKLIPWENYAQLFPSNTGTEAKPRRMALGALIIKEKCGFSDRETVLKPLSKGNCFSIQRVPRLMFAIQRTSLC